jgi:hypothetical protein
MVLVLRLAQDGKFDRYKNQNNRGVPGKIHRDLSIFGLTEQLESLAVRVE